MPARPSRIRRLLWQGGVLLLFALAAYAGWIYATLPTVADMARLARETPKPTALMRARGGARRWTWVPLERIDRRLVAAVLASEDAAFWIHDGFDAHELGEALKEAAAGKKARGASTLTQQLAKNLWLGEERSLGRKLKEALLTARLEEALTKERILALYLNIAEWGEGVWGAEAAAQEHFGHGAALLQPWEAVALAAMLPSPRKLALARKNPRLVPRVERVARFLVERGELTPAQGQAAVEEVRRRVGTATADRE